MQRFRDRVLLAGAISTALSMLGGCRQQSAPAVDETAKQASSPTAAATQPNASPERNAYFGDLHLHTSMSFDAFTFKTNTLPEDSYRFALGETVDYLGRPVKRRAALDFLAVTDHSEYLGVMRIVADKNGPYASTEWNRLLNNPDVKISMSVLWKVLKQPPPEFLTDQLKKDNWQREIDAAEKFNQPGKFTAFVAYEWSSMPNSANLHRNVIFRGPKYPDKPFSSIDSAHPEDLWSFLDNERKQGVEALAIPHNANASDGLMFDYKDSNGNAITRDYAETRLRNEPVVEISQAKGTSETRPELSPEDEFAGFEIWNHLLATTRNSKIDGSYVRQAYGRGLELQARVGSNPYKFGLIGATDFHSGVSATEENNFPGGHGLLDSQADPAKLLGAKDSSIGDPPTLFSAGALTGVWAQDNTRDAIFEALKRKEVFATSGNRIKLRLFAGWSYASDLIKQGDWVHQAYATGVPMGSDLPARGGAATPVFLIDAVKDPDAANLDRVQIVKVWLKDGSSHEKVFDALWSDGRKPDPRTGKLPVVGTTVNVDSATYSNSIGAAELLGQWSDPEFDATAPATYYARVLEIPTPRWSTYLAAKAKVPVPGNVAATIQERAWSSPVWYQP